MDLIQLLFFLLIIYSDFAHLQPTPITPLYKNELEARSLY